MNFFTIPNAISGVRILMVPVFLWLWLGEDRIAEAGWLLGVIAATDWIDGYLARRLNQVSTVGEFLDPLADRLAVVSALIGGIITDDIPRWFAIAVLAREAFIAVGALTLGLKAKAKLTVRFIGKVATAAIYASLAWFLIGRGSGTGWIEAAAWAMGLFGIVLYYISAFQYYGDLRQQLASR